jgi:hypothetical protein
MADINKIQVDTADLKKRLLDYAVAMALRTKYNYKIGEYEGSPDSLAVKLPSGGIRFIVGGQSIDWVKNGIWRPSQDYAQSAPFIDTFDINLTRDVSSPNSSEKWIASIQSTSCFGESSMDAVCRVVVALIFGDVFELPKDHYDLLK